MNAKRPCIAVKYNRRTHDFTCDKGLGHTDAHRDPTTGMSWKYPALPYGMRGGPPKISNRSKTKHGTYYSAAPARN